MTKERLPYRYNCVSPNSLAELNYIVDNSDTVSYRTFVSKINRREFNEICINLGYTQNTRNGLHIKDDFMVSYHKSKLPDGRLVYFFAYSGVEYIFY